MQYDMSVISKLDMYTHTRSSLLSSLTCIHTYVHTNVHLCVRRYIDDFDTLIRIL